MGIRPEDITDYEDAVKSEFEQKALESPRQSQQERC